MTDPKSPDTITITRDEYESLLDAQSKLDALEAWGVDNWDGYDDAMNQYHEEREQHDVET